MNKNTIILLVIISLKFVLQYFLIHPSYDLQRDEYLHLDQADHLAWGYISVPPVTSWISFLIKILGNGFFWVKFFPALFGALTIVLAWKITEILNGKLYALLLCATAILLSSILRLNILFQPNSLDVFSWTLVFFTVVKYVSTRNGNWLIATCIAFAFGFLCKYNIVFLLASLVPAILLTQHRKVFLEKKLYAGIVIGILIVLPNIVWQIQNNFPTIAQLKELSESQLVHVSRMDFLKDQFLLFAGSFFIIIAGFIAFIIYPPFRNYRFILISFIFSIALFAAMRAKSYYAIGLYPVILAAGSVYLESIFTKGWKYYLRPVAFILVLILSIPFIILAFPYKKPDPLSYQNGIYKSTGMLRWEDGKDHQLPQDFADMLGWRELAHKVDSLYSAIPDKTNTLIFCNNYGQAGSVNYYSKIREVNATSFNADYINWIKFDKPIRHIILVQEKDDIETLKKLSPFFSEIIFAGKIEDSLSREYGTTIHFLKNAKINLNNVLSLKRKEILSENEW